MTRRTFAAATAAVASAPAAVSESPALLGGDPVRNKPFPSWPVIRDNDESAWMGVLRSGKWNRLDGVAVRKFEEEWARRLGAKYCLATANGTSALITSLAALGVGPGDEVIIPPYTFVATMNAVLIHYAVPVFVDTDRLTSQIDATKIEAAITPRTRCIMPVHLGGAPADMDRILAIGRKHNIPVLEDACQAHFGEWRNRKLSTLGDLGCFSFQASKNLNSGEGGAILTSNEKLVETCRSFHNNGRGKSGAMFSYVRNGANLRLTEFQGTLLTSQLERLEEQSHARETNAEYLTSQLREVPGLTPAKPYEGCTRNAYHLYMFRYDPAKFGGLPRERFLKAMAAEGVPCSGGYTPLDREPLVKNTLTSRGFTRIYGEKFYDEWRQRTRLPENDRLCTEAVWLTQTMLLGGREDMEDIARAARKIQKNAERLKA